MKWVVNVVAAAACLGVFQSAAPACDQQQVMNPHFLSIPINSHNYPKIASSALTQADALQSCIASTSGHTKTHYLLMRAVALSTAAQAMDNMNHADRVAEAHYSKEAVAIAKPIASDPNALARERQAARGILAASSRLKKTD